MNTKKYDNAICKRIKIVRELNNLTREQLAEDMKENVFYIISVERKRHTPHFDFLVKFKAHFNLTWEWLIEGKGKMSPLKAPHTDI